MSLEVPGRGADASGAHLVGERIERHDTDPPGQREMTVGRRDIAERAIGERQRIVQASRPRGEGEGARQQVDRGAIVAFERRLLAEEGEQGRIVG